MTFFSRKFRPSSERGAGARPFQERNVYMKQMINTKLIFFFWFFSLFNFDDIRRK